MIPEYRLIKSFKNLKSNQTLKKEFKNKLFSLGLDKKNVAFFYNNIFNKFNNTKVFNNILSLTAELNEISLTQHFTLINDFNCLVISLIPTFIIQKKQENYNYNFLLAAALKNSNIDIWYNNALKNEVLFLSKSFTKKIDSDVLNKIKILTHCTGKLFSIINFENKLSYNYGYLLMLFYLLNFETKIMLKFKKLTTWNFASVFSNEELFTTKLEIIEKLNHNLMNLHHKDFNLYWRLANYILNS